jgi:hypothetical protein
LTANIYTHIDQQEQIDAIQRVAGLVVGIDIEACRKAGFFRFRTGSPVSANLRTSSVERTG